MDGSVVPTATAAVAPRARMAGVEITAPPTPKAAERMPVITPAATVSTSRSGPGSTGGLSSVCPMTTGDRLSSLEHLRTTGRDLVSLVSGVSDDHLTRTPAEDQ